jgi:imidazolonepropionase-like amidohydrolase
VTRPLMIFATLALASCAATKTGTHGASNRPESGPVDHGRVVELAPGESGFAILCGKLFTMNAAREVFEPGLIVVRGERIDYAGPSREVPAGYERLERLDLWATPGMIDLHSHVQTGGWGDINDMVISCNPELRTSPTIRPGNPNIQRACAAGVTTLFGIPGSGTNNSGFGVLYKTRCSGTYEDAVLADPGGMKVAQAYNPERGADLGLTRAGMAWNLADLNDKALAANGQGRDDPALRNLQKVMRKELPVLIHTAGSDACHTTISMWRERYDTRSVLSHGCFDGWKVAEFAARAGIPCNLGPRTFDWSSSREGQWIGTPERYEAAGVDLISVNTDAGVMPQEELFLQSAMGARYGATSYKMLEACTVNPALSFGIDQRVGSLQPGRDADVVLWNGDPLDPRNRVEVVWIEGKIEYDRAENGQRF